MNISYVLSTTSVILTLVAYVVYNRSSLFGETRPNASTWGIWSTISLISTATYIMVTKDFWPAVIMVMNSFLCIGTFVLVLWRGKFSKPDFADIVALCLGISAGLVWLVFHSAGNANLIIQVAILIGFIPTWRGQWRGTVQEKPLAWFIWVVDYFVFLTLVLLGWKGDWIALVYPINCIVLHLAVIVLAKLKPPVVLPMPAAMV